MALIELSGVSRTYKTVVKKKGLSGAFKNLLKPEYKKIEAVKDLSFTIKRGEAVGFIGPNGAGKSTTVKMLTGILEPGTGKVLVNGFDPVKDRKRYVASIGVVFGQRTQLWWDLPVADTLDLLKSVYQISNRTFKENMEIFQDILGLADFMNQPVRQLSLGQRMRADLAAALLHNPDCLFLDEPTIGLDVVAKKNIREFIGLINRERKTSILFTTHDMVDLEKTCRRIMIIDKGALVYDGSLDQIRKSLGGNRRLEVEFTAPPGKLQFPDVEIEDHSEYKKSFIFHRDKVQISQLIQQISEGCSVSDLTVKEPEIEGIIADIYRNGI